MTTLELGEPCHGLVAREVDQARAAIADSLYLGALSTGCAYPPFGAAHERELVAVTTVHNQALCIAAVLDWTGVCSDLAGCNRDAKRARHR